MKRIAAPMVGGLVTSFLLELAVYPAIFAVWKGRGLPRNEPATAESRCTFGAQRGRPNLSGLGGGAPASRVRVSWFVPGSMSTWLTVGSVLRSLQAFTW